MIHCVCSSTSLRYSGAMGVDVANIVFELDTVRSEVVPDSKNILANIKNYKVN